MLSTGGEAPTAGPSHFRTTHWSVILATRNSQTPEFSQALDQLCRDYWQPVYAFIRRSVSNPEDARDLTQGFFADLLENRSFARAHPAQGRFRSFLLGALRHFLADYRDQTRTQKRGGQVKFVVFDTAIAEARYGPSAHTLGGSEAYFDRGWAFSLLERGLFRLREEFNLSGRSALFDGLKPFLMGGGSAADYSQAGETLRITPGAAKMTVTRMRQRFRAIIRQEIAQTVSTPQELEEELRGFIDALHS